MKLAPIFKEYLKDLEGYESNKIENPSLTYETYKAYSNLDDKKEIPAQKLTKIKELFNEKKISEEELYQQYLKRELKNYQKVVDSFLINDEFLTKKISVQDIKNISKVLLSEITEFPFNQIFTLPFAPTWNKKTQKLETLNIAGEFRKTSLYKNQIKYRPANDIEKDLKKILIDTYEVLENNQASLEDKIKALSLFHLNFEFIHPFSEGNGRTGRIVLNILSLQFNLLPPAFGSEQSNQLKGTKWLMGYISPERYKEIINFSLLGKEKKDWNLIVLLPSGFKEYYFFALAECINWGWKTREKNKKNEKLINMYYSDYSKEEENKFMEFHDFIIKKADEIIDKAKKNLADKKIKIIRH